ncbi:Uncharacterised protein [Mycobacterium tuberculosis]|nr:Uncharacterised protein [Mycobacterium tuberculosis]
MVTHLLSPALGQRKHHVGTERSDIVDRTFAVPHGYHLASLHRLRDLDGGRAHSAGGAEHQHGVSRSQRGTPSQGEVHGVVVHQQRHRPGVIELDGAANHIGHRYGYLFGVAAEHSEC